MFSRFWFSKWFFNEQTGEWQRILGHDKHGPIVDATPQNQRRVTAWRNRKDRKGDFISALIFVIPLAWYSLAVVKHPMRVQIPLHDHDAALVATWLLWLCLAPVAIWAAGVILRVVVVEGFYLFGFQRMRGAQVIDPPPRAPPGPDLLFNQMGHGRAGPATPSQVQQTYGGNRQGEPQRRFNR